MLLHFVDTDNLTRLAYLVRVDVVVVRKLFFLHRSGTGSNVVGLSISIRKLLIGIHTQRIQINIRSRCTYHDATIRHGTRAELVTILRVEMNLTLLVTIDKHLNQPYGRCAWVFIVLTRSTWDMHIRCAILDTVLNGIDIGAERNRKVNLVTLTPAIINILMMVAV